MNEKIIITGKIVSGAKQAAFFTQLDWVQEQCLAKLGFKPFRGTLNIEIPDETIAVIAALQKGEIPELIPPDSNFCAGRVCPVIIESFQAAIVIPEEKVSVHGKNIIEIISNVKLKDTLDLEDGDIFSFSITRKSRLERSVNPVYRGTNK